MSNRLSSLTVQRSSRARLTWRRYWMPAQVCSWQLHSLIQKLIWQLKTLWYLTHHFKNTNISPLPFLIAMQYEVGNVSRAGAGHFYWGHGVKSGTSEMWFTASEDRKQSRSSAVNTNYSVAQFAGKLGDTNCESTPRCLEMNDNYPLHYTSSLFIPIRKEPTCLEILQFGVHKIVWMCGWHPARSQLSGLPLQPASIFSRGILY